MKSRRKILASTLAASMLLFGSVPTALGAVGNVVPKPTHQVMKFKQPGGSLDSSGFSTSTGSVGALNDKAAKARQAFQGMSPDTQVAVIVELSQKPAVNKGTGVKQVKPVPKPGNSPALIGADRIDQNQVDANKAQQTKVLNTLHNAGVQSNVKRQYTNTFNGYAASIRLGDLDKIVALDDVLAVYPDGKVQKTEVDSIASMAAANVPGPNGALTGDGVVVAVIDTGVDYSHPDLGGISTSGKYLGGYDFVNNDPDPMDDEGHGTHVAGIIAGLQDKDPTKSSVVGVAPAAKLLAYKVLDSSGWGTDSEVIAGIDRAVIDGADIMNLSLGSANGFQDDPTAQAIDNAAIAGVLPVISAGNSGPDYGDMMGTIGSPGTALGALTVAAMDGHDNYPSVNFTVTSSVYDAAKDPQLVTTETPMQGFVMANDFSALSTPLELVDCGLGNSPAEFVDESGQSKVQGKIALIKRGVMPFVTKLANAKAAGAAAAIIFNLSNQDVVYPVVLGNDPTLLPASGVLKYSDGVLLKGMIQASTPDYPVKVTFGAVSTLPNPLVNQIASFSSRGLLPNYDLKPDVSAPGVNVLSLAPNNGYATMSGTSMASPNAAGVAALLLQAHPNYMPGDLKVAMMNTAKDLQYDAAAQGSGLVQAQAANQLPYEVYAKRHNTMSQEFKTGNMVFGAVGKSSPDIQWVDDAVNGVSATTNLFVNQMTGATVPDALQFSVGSVYKMTGGMRGAALPTAATLLINDAVLTDTPQTAVPAEPTAPIPGETSFKMQLKVQDTTLVPGDYEMILNVSEPNGVSVQVPVVFSVPVGEMFRNGYIEYPYISPNWNYYGNAYTGISFDTEQDIDALKVEVYDTQNQFVGTYLYTDHTDVALWQQQGYVLGNLNRGKYWIAFDGIAAVPGAAGTPPVWNILPDGKYQLKIEGLKKGGNPGMSGDWVSFSDLDSPFQTGNSVVIDTQMPNIKLTSPNSGYWKTVDTTLAIKGEVDDPNLDSLMLDGNSVDLQGNAFSQTVTLQAGQTQTIDISAADLAGNIAHWPLTVEQINTPVVAVTAVTLNKHAVTLPENNAEMLTATVAPDDATIRQVEWKTDNPDVAQVDQFGFVWTRSPGTANITATSTQDPTKSDTCVVTVPSYQLQTWGEPRFDVGEQAGEQGRKAGVFIGLNNIMEGQNHTALSNNQIAGYQVVLHYDPSKVKISGVQNMHPNEATSFVYNDLGPEFTDPSAGSGHEYGSDAYAPNMRHLLITGAGTDNFDANGLVFVPLEVTGSVYDQSDIYLQYLSLSDASLNHIGVELSQRRITLSRGHVLNESSDPDVTDAVGALQFIVGGKGISAGTGYKMVNTVNLDSIDATNAGTTMIDHVVALMQYLAKMRDQWFELINK